MVDTDNSAGFADGGGEQALVAVYTTGGFGAPRPNQPGANACVQAIAYSTDRGRTFRRYAGNPVLGHLRAQNRDPKVIRHAATGQWIMALFLDGNDFTLYASADLKEWRHLCDLEVADTGECPDLFELPVDGDLGDTRWVFWGAAGVYRLGSFDGITFTPETPALRCELGPNGYAAQTWSDVPADDGRRIQISWLRGGHFPAMPFNGQMSFPVELTLRSTPQGVRLCRQPVKELELLHRRTLRWRDHRLSPGLNRHDLYHVHGPGWQSRLATDYRNLAPDTTGDLFHVEAEIDPGDAAAFGINVQGHDLRYNTAGVRFTWLDNTIPAPHDDNGHLRLQLLVDRTSLELFAAGGLVSAFLLLPAGRVRHAPGVVRRGRHRPHRLAGRPRAELGLAASSRDRLSGLHVEAAAEGSRTGTPAGSKWRTLRVTTVRPCSSAVAAMSRSPLSWPRRPDRRPHRRAADKSTARMRSPYRASNRSNQALSSCACAGSRLSCRTMPRSISPTDTTLRWRSALRCRLTHRAISGWRLRFRSADRTSVSIRNISLPPAAGPRQAVRTPRHLAVSRAAGPRVPAR